MGNYVFADTLIGMTIDDAREYLENNKVYLDTDNTKYRLLRIRVIYPNGMYTKDYCPNRVHVLTSNGVITKISGSG